MTKLTKTERAIVLRAAEIISHGRITTMCFAIGLACEYRGFTELRDKLYQFCSPGVLGDNTWFDDIPEANRQTARVLTLLMFLEVNS